MSNEEEVYDEGVIFPDSEKLWAAIERLEACISMLPHRTISDEIHVEALRKVLPGILQELKDAAGDPP